MINKPRSKSIPGRLAHLENAINQSFPLGTKSNYTQPHASSSIGDIFLARITDLEPTTGRYSWTNVIPYIDGDELKYKDAWRNQDHDAGTGEVAYAYEANGRIVPPGEIVILFEVETIVSGRRHIFYYPDNSKFTAAITGHEVLGYGKFKYEWVEVDFYADGLYEETDGGRSWDSTSEPQYAYNTVESNHDGQYIYGIDTQGVDYPGQFQPQPIGTGGDALHHQDIIVEMTEFIDPNGNLGYRFQLQGTHDGECGGQEI